MPPWMPQFRFLFPLILTSTVSFAVCGAMAMFMMREQAKSAQVLGESIASYRAVAKLEESLLDVLALLRTQVESVRALHERIGVHVNDIKKLANTPEEQRFHEEISASFSRYLGVWKTLAKRKGRDHEEARLEAVRVLETDTLERCQAFRSHQDRQVDEAEGDHYATIRGMAWGLAVLGGMAALAGLFLGYGAARGLNLSIQRLQIGIRDAAGKLTPTAPTLEFSKGTSLNQLHDQVQVLIGQIEATVRTLHQREREVLRAEQMAAVGQLAAGMAHEIRNPLMSIKMLIQAAREEGDAGGLAGEDLVVIDREIRQMQNTIQGFLDFARPPKLHKATIEAGKVLTQTIDLVRGRLDKQKIELVVNGPPSRFVLEADPTQLQQVLLNLMLNALDMMPSGGKLIVGVRSGDGIVEISVTDTGPGIGPEMRPRLFQPFATSKPTGLGLGLVISRRIVEDHGGILDIDPAVRDGACFRIRLPIMGALTMSGSVTQIR